jgi:hypothetical protein
LTGTAPLPGTDNPPTTLTEKVRWALHRCLKEAGNDIDNVKGSDLLGYLGAVGLTVRLGDGSRLSRAQRCDEEPFIS